MTTYAQYIIPKAETCVNLGAGQPDTSKLPIDWFKKTLNKLGDTIENPEFLQYHEIPGYLSIRRNMAKWLTQKYYNKIVDIDTNKMLDVAHSIRPEQIIMTNGNTGAIQMILNLFVESGDEIIIENPTYFIAKKMFDEYGLRTNPVSLEDDGINIEELEETIENIIETNEKYPQNKIFLYTIPIHHNPTSVSMSHKKRIKLAKLCDKYPNFYIIADEVYHFLDFENTPVYPLADYHPNILSLGSFSKILSPSIRVGWIYNNIHHSNSEYCNDESLLDVIKNSAFLDSGGGINPLGFAIIESAIDDGSLNQIMEDNIKMLNSRCSIMIDYLEMFKNHFVFRIPKGGYFLWLKTKVNTKEFFKYCEKNGVKFHSGDKFGDCCEKYLRLSFSFYNENDILIGLERLTALYETFIKTRISICGSTGKLGKLIIDEIDNNPNYLLLEPITREINVNPNTNVIIDVSSKDGTKNLIDYLIKMKLNYPLIIGTTGLEDETKMKIEIYSKKAPVALISNFSDGIPKFKKIVDELDKLGINWKFNLIEKHHIHKKDSPSGTAKTLVDNIKHDCEIKSIREGEIVGYHELHIENESEEITIIHNAKSRNIFAKGCMKYIPWILKQKNGIYYEITNNIPEYVIYTHFNKKIIITENNSLNYKTLLAENPKVIAIVFLSNNFYWDCFTEYNDKEYIDFICSQVVVKYIAQYHQNYNGTIENKFNKQQFIKTEDNKLAISTKDIRYHSIKDEFVDELKFLIQQITTILVKEIYRFTYDNKPHIIIEVENDVKIIDTDVITTLGAIINGDKPFDEQFNIDFINIKDKNSSIIIKSFSKEIGTEVELSVSGCICAVDFLAYELEHSYNKDLTINVQTNKEVITVYYHNKIYYTLISSKLD